VRYDRYVILVVEDDDDVRDLLTFALRNRGFTVEAVTNGQDALATLATRRPCLVILDLVMPGMSGQQLLVEMKGLDNRDVPVCVISALSDAAPQGAIATLAKPFEISAVVALASRYCVHGPAAGRG
jgi:DNA-binding response OmpR family regulator